MLCIHRGGSSMIGKRNVGAWLDAPYLILACLIAFMNFCLIFRAYLDDLLWWTNTEYGFKKVLLVWCNYWLNYEHWQSCWTPDNHLWWTNTENVSSSGTFVLFSLLMYILDSIWNISLCLLRSIIAVFYHWQHILVTF